MWSANADKENSQNLAEGLDSHLLSPIFHLQSFSIMHSPHRSAAPRDTALLPLLNRFLILLIICGTMALALMTFYPEWKKLSRMRQALQQKRQDLEQLQGQATHRERELYLLQHDKEYLELIARDRLDLMKPNETIFRLGPSRNDNRR
ncbi:MAG: septum formation initiator family protein [Verrucomicrobia bacterium]|nr:septum formation initiator family protein [Verrucomicrobiota bacterium]